MWRRALHIVSTLSLVLLLGVAVLWIRSVWVGDRWDYVVRYQTGQESRGKAYRLTCGRGGLDVSAWHLIDPERNEPGFYILPSGLGHHRYNDPLYSIYGLSGDSPWRRLGFGWFHTSKPWEDYWWAVVPCWFACLLTAVLPTWSARQLWLWRRWHHRLSLGLCPACGYDLRATPNRCPECGRPTDNDAGKEAHPA